MVRRAQEAGCIIGSSSDRAVSAQTALWERANITVDFTSLKHMLSGVKERFEADHYYHTGDRDLDRQFALEAGFEFFWMTEGKDEPWLDIVKS